MIFRLGIILGLIFNILLLKFFYTVFFEFFFQYEMFFRFLRFWPKFPSIPNEKKVKLLLKQLENYTQYSPILDLSFD